MNGNSKKKKQEAMIILKRVIQNQNMCKDNYRDQLEEILNKFSA